MDSGLGNWTEQTHFDDFYRDAKNIRAWLSRGLESKLFFNLGVQCTGCYL